MALRISQEFANLLKSGLNKLSTVETGAERNTSKVPFIKSNGVETDFILLSGKIKFFDSDGTQKNIQTTK